jgi:hypothetical protein
MRKKKWLLLVLSLAIVIGYIKLFYKNINYEVIPITADYVALIDVKRVANTVIWELITHPNKWKMSNPFSSKDSTTIAWDDMVELPDFIQIFHNKDQPIQVWNTVLTIKDEADFKAGLQFFKFIELTKNCFTNTSLGISLWQHDKQLLISNIPQPLALQYLKQTATTLFTETKFIAEASIKKLVLQKSHVAVLINAPSLLQEEGIVRLNMNGESVDIAGDFSPKAEYMPKQEVFNAATNSICVFGFCQPPAALLNAINDSTKAKFSTALNFSIDSFLLPQNKQYLIDVKAFLPRIDSAISYTYDDDFNAIEKVVVNTVVEPSFCFTTNGKASAMFNYLRNNQKIEPVKDGFIYTSMPFVKTYCKVSDSSSLQLQAFNYVATTSAKQIQAICFFELYPSLIPPTIKKYLPSNFLTYINNIEKVNLVLNKSPKGIFMQGSINKKDKTLPYFHESVL